MADLSGLFPQPPQQNQQNNSLLNNPGQAIGILNALQEYKSRQQEYQIRQQEYQIRQQQAPAVGQQPAQDLALKQAEYNFRMRQLYSGRLGNYLSNLGRNATDDEVRNEVTNAVRDAGGASADIANGIGKEILQQKDRRGFGNVLNSRALPPEAQSQRVQGPSDPYTGAPTTESLGAATARGPIAIQAPPGTAEQRQAEEGEIASFNARTNPLRKLVDLEEQLKANGTPIGPGSAGRNRIEAFINTAFPGLASEASKNKVSLYDQFTKYAAQNSAQISQGLAPHTNEGLNTVVHGSPNTENVAAGDLAKVQLAMESMRTANLANAHRKDEAGNYIVPLNKVAGEKSRVGLDMDYRAFIPRSAEEWAGLAKDLKGDERKRFNRSLQYGIKSGVIQLPGQ